MGALDNIDQWFQLPPAMNDFILKQVEYGLFTSKTHYWKHLIRELMLGNTIKAFKKNELPRGK